MATLTATVRNARTKAGGSSAGDYPGVKKFAGPAGGAPAGTFPINTQKRARSALAYAHNAPDPAGIKRAVERAYPAMGKSQKRLEKAKGW